MKSLSIFFVLLFTSTLLSQEKSFQAEFGFNRSWFNYELDALNEVETEFQPQITLGLHYKIYSFDNFTVNAGIRYYNLSRYLDMSQFGYSDGTLATFDHYLLSAPVQINYNIEDINTNVLINFETSYILKSKIKSPNFLNSMSFETRDVTNEMNPIQFAIGFGLEYVFNLAQQKFGIKLCYNIGLTSIPKEGEFTNSSGTYEWAKYSATELNLSLVYYF